MLPRQIKNVGKMISYRCIFVRFFCVLLWYVLCRLHMWSGHRALTGNYTKNPKTQPENVLPNPTQRQILNQMKPSSVTFKCSSNNLRQRLTTNVLAIRVIVLSFLAEIGLLHSDICFYEFYDNTFSQFFLFTKKYMFTPNYFQKIIVMFWG